MTDQPCLSFQRFYTYQEMTDYLFAVREKYSDFVSVESIGRSYEGRDIWAVTISSPVGGAPSERPALYIDANIHAGEVMGSSVCLYVIQSMLNGYGSDEMVTHILDTRTLYVIPRVNPDGAELYLSKGDVPRSSVRPNPDFRLIRNHLYPQDINGDGEILEMRIRDPNGAFRVSEHDNRVMVPREFDHVGGEYFSIYPEGLVHDYDGGDIRIGPPPWDLDMNRNFPADWKAQRTGTGRFPLSEPETRALAEFITGHPNIASLQSYHTRGGKILRPPSDGPDSAMDHRDMEIFELIARAGSDLTGYSVESTYFSYSDGRGSPKRGALMDWAYKDLGRLAYITELWDKYSRAGISRDDVCYVKALQEDARLELMRWHDREQLDSFVDWTPMDHPQLGSLEIGGFKMGTFEQNTHFKFLEEECAQNASFIIKQAAALPRIAIADYQVQAVSPGVMRVSVDVVNEGYLPTHVTYAGEERGLLGPVIATIHGEDLQLLRNEAQIRIGHLSGYGSSGAGFFSEPPANLRRVEWLIASEVDSLEIVIDSECAGTDRLIIDVGVELGL